MKKFRKPILATVLIISMLFTSNIIAFAGTWPAERHDQYNSGFNDEKIYPIFREKSSTNFPGYAPVYGNNKLYYNDGNKIYAKSVTDGRMIWYFDNPNSSLSPTLDGNNLYFGDLSGNLWAIEDASPPVVKWKKTGIATMNPLLVTDNYVIVNGSKPTENKVMAFDKTTGSKLWEANLYENVLAPSKGVGAPIRDGNHIIAATENNLYCFNISNGAKVWGPVDLKKEENTQNGTPILAGSNVIIKTPQNVVKAFDKNTGILKWTASFPSVPIKTGAVWGNNIYFLTDNGILTGLNVNDGSRIWQPLDLNLDGAAYAFNAPPIVVGRIIYFTSQDGTLFAVDAERGSLWHQQQLSGINSVDEFPLYMIAGDGMLIMSSGNNGYKVLEQDLAANDTVKPLIYNEKKSVGADLNLTAVIEDNLEGGVNPDSIALSVDGKVVPKESITYDQATKIMTANLAGFGAGNHQAVLTVNDMSNNQNGLTWDFYQDSDVPQINFTSLNSTDFFIGSGSAINFNFQLSETSNITAKILDANNNVIKTLLVNQLENAGSVSIIWDGKDNSGNIVSNGQYQLEVTTKDNSNNTAVAVTPSVNIHQKIDNFLSNLALSTSNLILGKDNQVNISYNLADNAQIKVVIATSYGNIVRTLYNGPKELPLDSSPIQQTWDLKDDFGNPVPAGNYIVRVMGTDTLGNGIELKTNLVINNLNDNLVTNLNITPDPFVIGGTNKATIDYELATNSVINVTITDSQGKVVTTLLNQAQQKPGINTLPLWDGSDLQGNKLLNGDYTLNVEARAGNGDICVTTKDFSLNQVGDKYEYNDGFQKAVLITTGETIATINPQGDVDYYKIYVPSNKALNLLLVPHKDMDGMVELYDDKEKLVNSSNTQGKGGIEKTGVFSKGQYFYIKVKDVNDSFSEASYSLNASFTSGDYWEVNEANKQPLPLKGNKVIADRTLDFYGDVDGFSFTAPSEGKVMVNFIAPQGLNGVIWVTNKKTGKKYIVNNNLGQGENFTLTVAPDDFLIFGVGDLTGETSPDKYKFSFTFTEGPLRISSVKATSPYSIKSGKKHNISFSLSKAATVKIDMFDSKKKRVSNKTITMKKGGPVNYSWGYTGSKKILAQKPIGKYTFVITAKDSKKKTVVYKGSFTVKK